jgi:hypothetical protein
MDGGIEFGKILSLGKGRASKAFYWVRKPGRVTSVHQAAEVARLIADFTSGGESVRED